MCRLKPCFYGWELPFLVCQQGLFPSIFCVHSPAPVNFPMVMLCIFHLRRLWMLILKFHMFDIHQITSSCHLLSYVYRGALQGPMGGQCRIGHILYMFNIVCTFMCDDVRCFYCFSCGTPFCSVRTQCSESGHGPTARTAVASFGGARNLSSWPVRRPGVARGDPGLVATGWGAYSCWPLWFVLGTAHECWWWSSWCLVEVTLTLLVFKFLKLLSWLDLWQYGATAPPD